MSLTPPIAPDAPFDDAELLDALPWGVLVLDAEGVIRRVNPTAARWCGAAPEALLHQPLAQALLPPALAAAVVRLLETGEPAPPTSGCPTPGSG